MKRTKLLLIALSTLFILSGTFLFASDYYNRLWWQTPYDPQIYKNFLEELKQDGYSFILPREFNSSLDGKIAIIIHDVDFDIHGAEVFMQTEEEFSVHSAFYLRPDADYFSQSIAYFQELEKQGWEIGFHYDSWSRTYPNKTLATELFTNQLSFLRTFFNIETTRSHGDNYNPSIYNYEIFNSTLWTGLKLRDFTKLDGFQWIADTNKSWKTPVTLGDRLLVLLHSDWW